MRFVNFEFCLTQLLTDGPEELDPSSEASQTQIPSADETGGVGQGQTKGRSVTEAETSLGFFMDKTSDRKMSKILQVTFTAFNFRILWSHEKIIKFPSLVT